MKKFLFLMAAIKILGCASSQESTPVFSMTEEQYEEATETYSAKTQKYDGPYNVLEATATIINSHVIEAQALRQATVFQWDKLKYQNELQTKQNQSNDKTEIFVSFFTPDKKSGDLTRNDTLWKILLRVDGKEFVGNPKKLSLLPVEIKNLYPRHNRWGNPYILTFPIPTKDIEKKPSELIITGPVGTASLQFNAIK